VVSEPGDLGGPAGVVAATVAAQRLRIVAALIGLTGDWDLAEDCVQDAAEKALRVWTTDGVPDRPGGWLTVVARNRAIDVMRRRVAHARNLEEAVTAEEAVTVEEIGDAPDIADDRLRLIFTCCHPALPLESRVALTLKTVCGLDMAAAARAFLVAEQTMSQRLLRARKKITHAGIPYAVPGADELPARVGSVLAVIYLVFNAGYSAGPDEPDTADLAGEAVHLATVLTELLPGEAESFALLALLLLQHSRRPARFDATGAIVTLEHQDRRRWSGPLIRRGLTALHRSQQLDPVAGAYRLQAAIAAEHTRAPTAQATDWTAIVTSYDELLRVQPSPVVALNRAGAVAMAHGPDAGLTALAAADVPALHRYFPLAATRAELLTRAGRGSSPRPPPNVDSPTNASPPSTSHRSTADRAPHRAPEPGLVVTASGDHDAVNGRVVPSRP